MAPEELPGAGDAVARLGMSELAHVELVFAEPEPVEAVGVLEQAEDAERGVRIVLALDGLLSDRVGRRVVGDGEEGDRERRRADAAVQAKPPPPCRRSWRRGSRPGRRRSARCRARGRRAEAPRAPTEATGAPPPAPARGRRRARRGRRRGCSASRPCRRGGRTIRRWGAGRSREGQFCTTDGHWPGQYVSVRPLGFKE